jgi:hypothetical protein
MSTSDRKQQSLTPREMDLFYFILFYYFPAFVGKGLQIKVKHLT